MSNNGAENTNISLRLDAEENVKNNLPVDSIPKMESVTVLSEEKGYSAGTIDESMLSEEEKETVARFAETIDIMNVDQMVQYGTAAQKNISGFSVSVLKQVKTLDLGEVGAALKELTIALDATIEPEKKGLAGLFQKAKRSVGAIMANYAKAETNVDRIEKDLVKHQKVLTADISMYQEMYALNTQYYKELTMYIIAGRKALDKAKIGDLAILKQKAEQTQKQEDIQLYKDYLDQWTRFDKRLGDLEITRMIAIQVAPQVRMLQNNDRELLDKLQSSLSNTIPLWRNQLVLSLVLSTQEGLLMHRQHLQIKQMSFWQRIRRPLKWLR